MKKNINQFLIILGLIFRILSQFQKKTYKLINFIKMTMEFGYSSSRYNNIKSVNKRDKFLIKKVLYSSNQ